MTMTTKFMDEGFQREMDEYVVEGYQDQVLDLEIVYELVDMEMLPIKGCREQVNGTVMTLNPTDTTALSYWLNWRFVICAIWVLVAMVIAALLIWRHEGRNKMKNQPNGEQQEAAGCLYDDEVWGTCSKSIHPRWLLAFRLSAFGAMLALILADVITRGAGIFYFYTQWTFTLVTFYFGLASSLSLYGCLHNYHELYSDEDYPDGTNTEQSFYVPPTLGDNGVLPSKNRSPSRPAPGYSKTAASAWGYALQIIFQICAGAVVLTDSVFWLVLYPFLSPSWYQLSFIIVCKHSVNAIFLLGDASLNRLRFPFFRIGYYFLFTILFVIFQWIIHAISSLRWPYPFLELSSPYAPAWYFGVGLLHFPCFGVFSLVFRLKRHILSR